MMRTLADHADTCSDISMPDFDQGPEPLRQTNATVELLIPHAPSKPELLACPCDSPSSRSPLKVQPATPTASSREPSLEPSLPAYESSPLMSTQNITKTAPPASRPSKPCQVPAASQEAGLGSPPLPLPSSPFKSPAAPSAPVSHEKNSAVYPLHTLHGSPPPQSGLFSPEHIRGGSLYAYSPLGQGRPSSSHSKLQSQLHRQTQTYTACCRYSPELIHDDLGVPSTMSPLQSRCSSQTVSGAYYHGQALALGSRQVSVGNADSRRDVSNRFLRGDRVPSWKHMVEIQWRRANLAREKDRRRVESEMDCERRKEERQLHRVEEHLLAAIARSTDNSDPDMVVLAELERISWDDFRD
ncbi:hypothetical protein HOO65_040823 [Ceratocystis lukuohia]|uniref:Uncharacterized protein n=1 Tax=Ceratocystis lukuohia TaxID=2019550 RepID=A0ABR4MJQ0_9PEZI